MNINEYLYWYIYFELFSFILIFYFRYNKIENILLGFRVILDFFYIFVGDDDIL